MWGTPPGEVRRANMLQPPEPSPMPNTVIHRACIGGFLVIQIATLSLSSRQFSFVVSVASQYILPRIPRLFPPLGNYKRRGLQSSSCTKYNLSRTTEHIALRCVFWPSSTVNLRPMIGQRAVIAKSNALFGIPCCHELTSRPAYAPGRDRGSPPNQQDHTTHN